MKEFKRPYKPELKVDNKILVGDSGYGQQDYERREREADRLFEKFIRGGSIVTHSETEMSHSER